jgi:hypothetical protein
LERRRTLISFKEEKRCCGKPWRKKVPGKYNVLQKN